MRDTGRWQLGEARIVDGRYSFTEAQADAILELRLYQLTALERDKVKAEYDALVARDYPLLLAGTALSAAFVLAGSFLAEVLQAWLDPRLRDA